MLQGWLLIQSILKSIPGGTDITEWNYLKKKSQWEVNGFSGQ